MGDEFRPQRADADPSACGELEILRHPSVEQEAAFGVVLIVEAQRIAEFVVSVLVKGRLGTIFADCG